MAPRASARAFPQFHRSSYVQKEVARCKAAEGTLSGQSSSPTDHRSRHRETGKTDELAIDTLEPGDAMTGNQGIRISDDQNSFACWPARPNPDGDFHLREKITHFDHERIPERVVHARGAAAHGVFQDYEDLSDLTSAGLLTDPSRETQCSYILDCSRLRGSSDTPRDVRDSLSNSTPRRASGIWSATTCRVLHQDPSSFPI